MPYTVRVPLSHGQGAFSVRVYGTRIRKAEISGNGLQTLNADDLESIITALRKARTAMQSRKELHE